MYIIVGLVLCIFSLGWIKFSSYYPIVGWFVTLIGVYFIFKGRGEIGLKNK